MAVSFAEDADKSAAPHRLLKRYRDGLELDVNFYKD
ncbi:MAG: hypothetical protein ETSY1_37920 [Candidatus Entotheonella factor]|uniref:Uncharacterized protein n=1 Tax=Entotheonella factor TaxID=1429438 RepID=W4L741_ENTF1|nr:MAG: hypothetical protein ETSY1_37920 [Candidatus Entotheonella factor]